MKIRITIETGNDAMRTGLDVARLLEREIVNPILTATTLPLFRKALRDENGNTVGFYETDADHGGMR
jgi:hypothetical protein